MNAEPSSRLSDMSGLRARLVAVFAAEQGLPSAPTLMGMATGARKAGDSVLIVDCDGGALLKAAGLTLRGALCDVLDEKISAAQAKHICPDSGLVYAYSGQCALEEMLGILAALSLSYDWVFVLAPAGCTPAHVRLAAAAERSALLFHGAGDRFMRAYWMLDAIRARAPSVDPLMIACGETTEAREAYALFAGTVRDFLGAPPALCALIDEAGPDARARKAIFAALDEAQTLAA